MLAWHVFYAKEGTGQPCQMPLPVRIGQSLTLIISFSGLYARRNVLS
jgi:hypothetical protein